MEINSIEEQIAWLVSQQASQKLASYTLGAISGESSKTVSKFDQQWLTFSRAALGLNQLEPGTGQLNVALKSNLLLPSLLVYSCKATGGELLPAFKGAVAWHFLIRASYLFDDIQDRDRPDSLVGQFGEGVALNLALILLEIGQQLEIEVLDEVFNPLYEASLEKASVIRIRKLHETIKQKLFQTISFAARGQLLDLQETSLETAELLDNLPYYLKKASLKSALIVSHITQLGAVISLAKPLSLSLEPEEVLKRIEDYKQFGFNFGIALHLINDLRRRKELTSR